MTLIERPFAILLACAWSLVPVLALGAQSKPPPGPSLPALSAERIAEQNVAARGGASAWRAVQTLRWKGKMGAGGSTYTAVSPKLSLQRKQRPEMELPFTMEFKRPAKSRLELVFNGQTAVQVFDGSQGWKWRPYLGRQEWEAYSADELRMARAEPGIDGWLIDFAAKGAKLDLAGTEMVEGQPAYKLKVTRKDGQIRHVWIDGKNFLEIKEDGEPRELDGKTHTVAVFMRDYRRVDSIMVPHLIETVVSGVPNSEKIVIEAVTVNPGLDDARFTKAK